MGMRENRVSMTTYDTSVIPDGSTAFHVGAGEDNRQEGEGQLSITRSRLHSRGEGQWGTRIGRSESSL